MNTVPVSLPSEDIQSLQSSTSVESIEVQSEGFVEGSDVVSRSSEDHRRNVLSSLRKLQCDGNFCDVTIKCGDFEVKAHRHVLASSTEYFKAMFLNETKEAKSGIVDFSAMSPKVVKQCIGFLYSGDVDISNAIARDLLDASEMMQLPELSKFCVEFLAERVDMESCAEILALCNLYNKGSLNESLIDFLKKHFEEFSQTNDFISLDYQDLLYCLSLLVDDDEGCEMQKWHGILAWTNSDPDEKRCHFPDLFEKINLQYLPKSFIKNQISPEKLINDSLECLRMMRDGLIGDVDDVPMNKSCEVISFIKDGQVIVSGTIRNPTVVKFPVNITLDMDLLYYKGDIYVGTGLKIYHYVFTQKTWTSVDVDFKLVKRCLPCITCWKCFRDHWYLGKSSFNREANGLTWGDRRVGFAMNLNTSPKCLNCGTIMDKKSSEESCYNRCIGSEDFIYMFTRNYIIEHCIRTEKLIHYDMSTGLGNGFFIAASNSFVYALGGNRTGQKAIAFSLSTKQITQLPNMESPKKFGRACFSGSSLYVAGKDSPYSMERYSIQRKIWCQSEFRMTGPPSNIKFGKNLEPSVLLSHRPTPK